MSTKNEVASTGNALTVPSEVTALMFSEEPMTVAERDTAVSLFNASDAIRRQILLAMFERKAHEADKRNKIAWDDFCAGILGLGDSSYAYQLLRWARIEREVFNLKNSVMTLFPKMPQKVALEIGKLPEEKWERVYEEYKGREGNGGRTPRELSQELKRIVKRETNPPTETASAPAATETVVPVKPRVPLRPIVPPTYDRGPEHDDDPIEEAPTETTAQDTEEAELLAEVNAERERLDTATDDAETSEEPIDIDAPHRYPATDDGSSDLHAMTSQGRAMAEAVNRENNPPIEEEGPEAVLLCTARKILRQFRHAVKTANQDLMYEADAAAAKFEKECEAADL